MICISVYDSSDKRRSQLRELLVGYMIRSGVEPDVLWFSEKPEPSVLSRYAARIQEALISLDSEGGREFGVSLSLLNPECRIIFYSGSQRDALGLLAARPRGLHSAGSMGELEALIAAVTDEIISSGGILRYQTRSALYCYPFRDVVYLRSDMKYVHIHLSQGRSEQLYAKLSDIEPLLDKRFIRIHKSYIVNSAYIEKISKKERRIYLNDGIDLPVSDAQYRNVLSQSLSELLL